MATSARERLQQLGLAQTEAEEVAARAKQNRRSLTGAELRATQIARPSEAEDIEAETTPLIDFGEFFLNQIGISSPRQVRASVEARRATHEANQTMLQAAREKLDIAARRSGGIDQDRLQAAASALDEAATLMDNQVPEIQGFGREKLLAAVTDLDMIVNEQSEFLGQARERIQGQLDNVLELGRQDERDSATVIGLLNERGTRDGLTSKLSVTEKQVLANYLGGSSFTQKIGAEGIIPSLSIPFDPSEQITVGDASVLVQAAKKARRYTIADQLGEINATAVGSGFSLADDDGRLTVNEIISPPLSQDVQDVMFRTPSGQPLNIRPGLPTTQDTRSSVRGFLERLGAGSDEVLNVTAEKTGTRGLMDYFRNDETGRQLRQQLNQNRQPGLFQEKETN